MQTEDVRMKRIDADEGDGKMRALAPPQIKLKDLMKRWRMYYYEHYDSIMFDKRQQIFPSLLLLLLLLYRSLQIFWLNSILFGIVLVRIVCVCMMATRECMKRRRLCRLLHMKYEKIQLMHVYYVTQKT